MNAIIPDGMNLPATGQRLFLRIHEYKGMNMTALEFEAERADVDRRLQSDDVIVRHRAFWDDKALKHLGRY